MDGILILERQVLTGSHRLVLYLGSTKIPGYSIQREAYKVDEVGHNTRLYLNSCS